MEYHIRWRYSIDLPTDGGSSGDAVSTFRQGKKINFGGAVNDGYHSNYSSSLL